VFTGYVCHTYSLFHDLLHMLLLLWDFPHVKGWC